MLWSAAPTLGMSTSSSVLPSTSSLRSSSSTLEVPTNVCLRRVLLSPLSPLFFRVSSLVSSPPLSLSLTHPRSFISRSVVSVLEYPRGDVLSIPSPFGFRPGPSFLLRPLATEGSPRGFGFSGPKDVFVTDSVTRNGRKEVRGGGRRTKGRRGV